MRSKLGRIAAVAVAGIVVMASVASGADAGGEAPSDATTSTTTTVAETTTTAAATTTTTTSKPTTTTTKPTTTTTKPTTTTTKPATTTTQPPAPMIAELPPAPERATPTRGTAAQVTDTIVRPTTTTTTTLPPWALPANSGEGRRVVYSKSLMRVWTVESNGTVSKTHLVSGRRTWNQPLPGTYNVFSRSSFTCNINNPHICWRYMVRFTKGPDGDNIGFHEIPTDTRTGYQLQSLSQLGQALSGGCVRQATPDAQYMWNWAPIGTKVVVLG